MSEQPYTYTPEAVAAARHCYELLSTWMKTEVDARGDDAQANVQPVHGQEVPFFVPEASGKEVA